MTKFIDNTKKNNSKKTVFKKALSFDFTVVDAFAVVTDYEKVEFIGTSKAYGDVFKALDIDGDFILYMGVKGSEFDEQ